MAPGDLAVIIPARNEADRIATTVTAAAKLDAPDIILVVDDGSTDDTEAAPSAAGPLYGQRRVTRAAFEAGRPVAAGWGVETGMTIDLVRKGLRVTEVEVPLWHRATGNDWRSQLHRLHQLADVTRALLAGEPAI